MQLCDIKSLAVDKWIPNPVMGKPKLAEFYLQKWGSLGKMKGPGSDCNSDASSLGHSGCRGE